MPFEAQVWVLIASPGDVVNERRLCRTVIADWNSMHAEQGVVLLPLEWDTDATPAMGDRPQGVLNRQLVLGEILGRLWADRTGRMTMRSARDHQLTAMRRRTRICRFCASSRILAGTSWG